MPDWEGMILARQEEYEIWEDCGTDIDYEYQFIDPEEEAEHV